MTTFSQMSVRSLTKSPRVARVDDERDHGNGIIVELKQGWSFDPMQDNRVAGADTVREALALVHGARPFAGPFTD